MKIYLLFTAFIFTLPYCSNKEESTTPQIEKVSINLFTLPPAQPVVLENEIIYSSDAKIELEKLWRDGNSAMSAKEYSDIGEPRRWVNPEYARSLFRFTLKYPNTEASITAKYELARIYDGENHEYSSELFTQIYTQFPHSWQAQLSRFHRILGELHWSKTVDLKQISDEIIEHETEFEQAEREQSDETKQFFALLFARSTPQNQIKFEITPVLIYALAERALDDDSIDVAKKNFNLFIQKYPDHRDVKRAKQIVHLVENGYQPNAGRKAWQEKWKYRRK